MISFSNGFAQLKSVRLDLTRLHSKHRRRWCFHFRFLSSYLIQDSKMVWGLMKESSTVFEGQIALLLYSYVDVYDIAIRMKRMGLLQHAVNNHGSLLVGCCPFIFFVSSFSRRLHWIGITRVERRANIRESCSTPHWSLNYIEKPHAADWNIFISVHRVKKKGQRISS